VLGGVNEEIEWRLGVTKIHSEIHRWRNGIKIARIELNDASF
jgi:hypothetical protein